MIGRFVSDVSPGYKVIATDVRQSGAAHRHWPIPASTSQFLTLQSRSAGSFERPDVRQPAGLVRGRRDCLRAISRHGQTWQDLWKQVRDEPPGA
jgi:hypothetical protein